MKPLKSLKEPIDISKIYYISSKKSGLYFFTEKKRQVNRSVENSVLFVIFQYKGGQHISVFPTPSLRIFC